MSDKIDLHNEFERQGDPPGDAAMRTSETRKLAKRIVQYCLSWADRGRFEGKGDARKLLFPSIVNRRTGDIVQVEERMIDDVATMLEEEINP